MVDRSRVTKIIVLCGSNNIDGILHSPKHQRNFMISPSSVDRAEYDNCQEDIKNLVVLLHNWAPMANIKFLNILPRESWGRNDLISKINWFISKLAENHPYVDFISTESDRKLFTDGNGYRKSIFFSSKGTDNIHLNTLGVIRLAKHLKHIAHI